MNFFTVKSVNISGQKGVPKRPVEKVLCRKGYGIEGDSHAGSVLRQVSLLAFEKIASLKAKGLSADCGDFAENITTERIELTRLPVGTRLKVGSAELEITQIGKECHQGCAIRRQTGDCIMPEHGVFAKVIRKGEIKRGDTGSYGL